MLRRRLMMVSPMEIQWEVIKGTWNSSYHSWSADNLQWTCVSPGTNGMTVLRCHIYNFNDPLLVWAKSQAESTYDYLIVGKPDVDLSTTITSWSPGSVYTNSNVILHTRGQQGETLDVLVNNPDPAGSSSNHHFIDFMFGKDSSTDVQPDNATVFVEIYA